MNASNALLPSGFYDLLPPFAAFESSLVYRAMQGIMRFGYERVAPPLVEFEDSLLLGTSQAVDRQTFRVMDPLSQKTMGIRADMTMQIGRIAVKRMPQAPRPLRLCYSGSTLSTKSDNIFPNRQQTQAGAEIIGTDHVSADAEAITVAVHCLKQLGVERITVDINLPSLVALALQEAKIKPAEAEDILTAIANKDATAANVKDKKLNDWLGLICRLQGPAEDIWPEIKKAKFWPKSGDPLRARLGELLALLKPHLSGVNLTIDLTENRGFDYDHGGISFALFTGSAQGEIGRGGRYTVAADQATPATGFTIYLTRLLTILPAPKGLPRILIPADAGPDVIEKLQSQGMVTITGFDYHSKTSLKEAQKQATEQRCQQVWRGGQTIQVIAKDMA
ncbi:ATP phosphoribosyltransferase regulatory subunit [bacterium]|nr:ATP phosphoribosyltransferase regulatory subunit [bacterium]